jgi:hypothetical protein
MFDVRRLLLAAALAFHVAALPAADPNDDASDCSSSWSAYESSSAEYEEPYATSIITTTVFDSTFFTFRYGITTLCDGRARGLGPHESAFVVPTTSTLDYPWETVLYSTYTSEPPTCTTEASPDAPDAAVQTANPDGDLSVRDDYVPCNSGSCYIYAQQNRVLYWPVTTVDGDFCAQNGSTIFAEPTSPPQPNKAIVDGSITLTSPTNYISFGAAYAMNHGPGRHRTSCGPPPQNNVILPITESFYSGAYAEPRASYSFNFADLNTLPVEAYNRQRKCGSQHTACDNYPMFDVADYKPILPLPTELSNLEPEEWMGCRGTPSNYYFDAVALVTPAPTATSSLLMN